MTINALLLIVIFFSDSVCAFIEISMISFKHSSILIHRRKKMIITYLGQHALLWLQHIFKAHCERALIDRQGSMTSTLTEVQAWRSHSSEEQALSPDPLQEDWLPLKGEVTVLTFLVTGETEHAYLKQTAEFTPGQCTSPLFVHRASDTPVSPVGDRTLMSLDPSASLSFLLGPLHELLNYIFLYLSLSVFCMKLKV